MKCGQNLKKQIKDLTDEKTECLKKHGIYMKDIRRQNLDRETIETITESCRAKLKECTSKIDAEIYDLKEISNRRFRFM